MPLYDFRFRFNFPEAYRINSEARGWFKITNSTILSSASRNAFEDAENFDNSALPIDLGDNTIEVDSNLKLTQAGATGKFDYTVYLKENSLFDTETLKPPPPVIPTPPPPPPTPPPPPPPKTIGAGELLFSKLTDKMDMTFSYKFKSDKPVSQVAEEVEIKAALENPGVWSKTFVLVPLTKTSGDFTSTFSLDINQI